MRTGIYYWKCDSPLSPDAKRRQFFREKYESQDMHRLAVRCVERWAGEPPARIVAAGCDGNHFAFTVTLRSGETVFLRGDDGGGDDYMLAETAVTARAAARGVPTPATLFCTVDGSDGGVNFQILECIPHPPLDRFHKNGTLQTGRIAGQLGECLRRLHSVTVDGFGFFDTVRLRADGALRGLCASYADYFHTRLDEHVAHLERSSFLTLRETADIRGIFRAHEGLLRLGCGSLVHRDAALWNVLGTPSEVKAVIDWDDCVAGEPADDPGMLLCFHAAAFMRPLLRAYAGGKEPDPGFMRNVWLHMLRNMLWKAKLRESLGYFDRGAGFFLNLPGESASLRETTLTRIRAAVDYFKSEGKRTHGLV